MADRVLLTGITGFVGGHVALALLKAGYAVRGSLRDPGRAEDVAESLSRAGADVAGLEIVRLDLLDDAGWRKAAEGCRFVQHVASPFFTRMPEDRSTLVRPAVEGTRRVLEAGLAAGAERIVVTSSMAAISYGHDRARAAPFGASDWTVLDGRPVNAYVESKTRAEREAWNTMDRAGRREGLAVVNPAAILGPLLDGDPGTSVGLVRRLLDGGVPAAPRLGFGVVDVRDVAAVQVAAMTAPQAAGQRHPLSAGTRTIIEMARVLKARLPERAGKLPRLELPDWAVKLAALFDADMRSQTNELGVVKRFDASAAAALIGRSFIDPDEAVLASARSLIDLGLV